MNVVTKKIRECLNCDANSGSGPILLLMCFHQDWASSTWWVIYQLCYHTARSVKRILCVEFIYPMLDRDLFSRGWTWLIYKLERLIPNKSA
jgi:hypothetical protein